MSAPPSIPSTITEFHLIGMDDLRKRWTWLVGLGIAFLVMGTLAIAVAPFVTVATMVFFGVLMLFAGVLQTAHAIAMRGWSGFFIDLMAGVLYAVVGLVIIAHPGATAVALTLIIAILLILGGIFRLLIAISMRFHNRTWLLIHGIINLMLGSTIWSDWPVSGLWVIGVVIGLDMVFNGCSLLMLGLIAATASSSGLISEVQILS